MPESRVQREFLRWLSYTYPNVRKHVIKIHNEGARRLACAYDLGIYPGASDLFIAWPAGNFHGLFLELKRENWKMTVSQEEHIQKQQRFIDAMNARGYYACFAIGLQGCINAVEFYLKSDRVVSE